MDLFEIEYKYLKKLRSEISSFTVSGESYDLTDYFFMPDLENNNGNYAYRDNDIFIDKGIVYVRSDISCRLFINRIALEFDSENPDYEFRTKYNLSKCAYFPVIVNFKREYHSYNLREVVEQELNKYLEKEEIELLLSVRKILVLVNNYNLDLNIYPEYCLPDYYKIDDCIGGVIVFYNKNEQLSDEDMERLTNNWKIRVLKTSSNYNVGPWIEKISQIRGKDSYYVKSLLSLYNDPLIKPLIRTPYDIFSILKYCNDVKYDSDTTRWVDIADYGIDIYKEKARFSGLNPVSLIRQLLLDNYDGDEIEFNDALAILAYVFLNSGWDSDEISFPYDVVNIQDSVFEELVLYTNTYVPDENELDFYSEIYKNSRRNLFWNKYKTMRHAKYLSVIPYQAESEMKNINSYNSFYSDDYKTEVYENYGRMANMFADKMGSDKAKSVYTRDDSVYTVLMIMQKIKSEKTVLEKLSRLQSVFMIQKKGLMDNVENYKHFYKQVLPIYKVKGFEYVIAHGIVHLGLLPIDDYINDRYVKKHKALDDTLLMIMFMLKEKSVKEFETFINKWLPKLSIICSESVDESSNEKEHFKKNYYSRLKETHLLYKKDEIDKFQYFDLIDTLVSVYFEDKRKTKKENVKTQTEIKQKKTDIEFWNTIVRWPFNNRRLAEIVINECLSDEKFKSVNKSETATKNQDEFPNPEEFNIMMDNTRRINIFNQAIYACKSAGINVYTQALKKLYRENPEKYSLVYNEFCSEGSKE